MEADDVQKRIWHYWIDAEGHLWHDGSEFEDPGLLKFFMKKLERLPDGKMRVMCQGETCLFETEDVPYVIQGIEPKPSGIELTFPGNYRETLDPTTLRVGKDNVLYCKVRDGLFDARFNRKAYWDLAKQVDVDPMDHRYYFQWKDRRYPIAGI